ncbi:MAG: UDP-2,3-diacylglucosamine diphosphatase [Panacagrimonas sp.]
MANTGNATVGVSVCFISDLHLSPRTPALRERFCRFLQTRARQAEALYILGDLFEYWIGDEQGIRDFAAEIHALKALTDAGVPVYFQHGNRDFLLGARFCRSTGVEILPDPWILQWRGQDIMLSHGDRFCTDDVAYQRWRRFSRLSWAQWLFLRLPPQARRRIAGGLQQQSDGSKAKKSPQIMDVNPSAVKHAMHTARVKTLIHGHTHRPADHHICLDGQSLTRVVLADWRNRRCELVFLDDDGHRREVLR